MRINIFLLLLIFSGCKKLEIEKRSPSIVGSPNVIILGDKIHSKSSDWYLGRYAHLIGSYDSLENAQTDFKKFSVSHEKIQLLDMMYYHVYNLDKKYLLITEDNSDTIYKKVWVYSKRPNNFHWDSLLTLKNYSFYYRYYKTEKLNDTTVIITNKKNYIGARNFTKIVSFTNKGFFKKVLLINDYQLLDYSFIDGEILIVLNQPPYSSMFKKLPTYRIIRINTEMEILSQLAIECSQTLKDQIEFNESTISIFATIPFGCHICEWDFLELEFKIDKTLKNFNTAILNKPEALEKDSIQIDSYVNFEWSDETK